jgi:thiamine-phosphate pyrophosphorylase
VNLYHQNIDLLLTIKAKFFYDKETKIAIASYGSNDIFITEFLFAKNRGMIETLRGHSEIEKNYFRLLPYIFIHGFDEILENIEDDRVTFVLFDGTGRRIFHVVDSDNFLISVFVVCEKNFQKQLNKRFRYKSNLQGRANISSILSPASPFWRHASSIEELYQKLRQSMMKINSYLITDPTYYGTSSDSLELALTTIFSKLIPDFALFRDKQCSDYPTLAQAFILLCRQHNIPNVLLHGDYFLANTLGADGVHLTSTQFDAIKEAKALGLYVIISTHTHDEALKAQELGADAITYSPIYVSPNKGEPKGLEDLKEIVDKIRVPIFALGGITTQEQIHAVEECGVYGFASIRYFIDYPRHSVLDTESNSF